MSSTGTTAPTTFSGLWDELKTDALNMWEAAKTEAVTLEHAIVPVVEQDIVLVLSQLKTVALNTVMALAGQAFNNLTGAQKNAITVNTVVQAALASGKTIATQDAQLLAQQAYNGLASTVSTLSK